MRKTVLAIAASLAILPVSNNTTPPVFVTPNVTTVENGTYPFARQLFMMTLKFGALPTSGVRLDNYARAIDFVNTTGGLQGQTILNNDGEFTLTTTAAENPVTAGTCSTVGTQTVCPQTIPPWDVNVDGAANVNDFVLIGQVFLDMADRADQYEATQQSMQKFLDDTIAMVQANTGASWPKWQVAATSKLVITRNRRRRPKKATPRKASAPYAMKCPILS